MNDCMHHNTDILIVGAGPTGLALAAGLAQKGIRHLIVDRLATGQNTSRAAVIHAHTLEELEALGVTSRLMQAGLALSRFSVRDRDNVLARLDFDRLPSPYGCLLMLEQDRTEAILADALAQAGGTVQRGWNVETLQANEHGMEATVDSPQGRHKIRARYVVGADGMHSVVRRFAGIGFTGSSYEESFVLADVDMTWSPGRNEVMMFFSPQGPLVVAPLPAGRFRIVAMLDRAPERPDIGDIQRLLATRGPATGDIRVTRMHWSSRFRLHHRLADHYRQGRALLIGDAAHVHSPAGGQGMNTGLVDAAVLGKMLVEVISGRQPDSYLDGYELLRRPAASQVLALTGRLTAVAMVRGRPQQLLRNLVFRLIGTIAPMRRKLALNLSGISRRSAARLPSNGNVARHRHSETAMDCKAVLR